MKFKRKRKKLSYNQKALIMAFTFLPLCVLIHILSENRLREMPLSDTEKMVLFSEFPSPTPHPDSVNAKVYQEQVILLQTKISIVEQQNQFLLTELKRENMNRDRVINAIKNNLNGVFKGKAEYIYNTSKSYNVNPMLVAAIMYHETGNGTSEIVRNKNNPGGLMYDGVKFMSFSTLEEGIERMVRVLKKQYIDKGKDTIEKIQVTYCPVGAANDPTGLNKHWLTNVTAKYQKILSDAGGTL